MSVTTPPGRTHMYYTGTPEFAFGTGLSYSEFSLDMVESASAAAVDMAAPTQLEYKLKLSHRAGPPGKRTILAFWKPHAPRTEPGAVPLKQKLFGFASATLAAGEASTLSFTLNSDALAVANADGHKMLHAGDFTISFTDGHDVNVEAALTVTGEGARLVEPYPQQ